MNRKTLRDSSWDWLQPCNPENNAFDAVPKIYLLVAIESHNVINQHGLVNQGSKGYFIRLGLEYSLQEPLCPHQKVCFFNEADGRLLPHTVANKWWVYWAPLLHFNIMKLHWTWNKKEDKAIISIMGTHFHFIFIYRFINRIVPAWLDNLARKKRCSTCVYN